MSTTFTLKKLLDSPALWPTTGVYLSGVLAMMLGANGLVTVLQGTSMFSVLTLLILLRSVQVELRTVHLLVNSQHDALVARIGQLCDLLSAAGVTIPPDPNAKKVGQRI